MGEKILVVCDTNVPVSAVGWRGAEHELYRRCRGGALQLATSPELLDELRRVLRYPKLRLSEEDAAAFDADIRAHALVVEPCVRIRAVEADLDDNRVLECAVTARGVHHLG